MSINEEKRDLQTKCLKITVHEIGRKKKYKHAAISQSTNANVHVVYICLNWIVLCTFKQKHTMTTQIRWTNEQKNTRTVEWNWRASIDILVLIAFFHVIFGNAIMENVGWKKSLNVNEKKIGVPKKWKKKKWIVKVTCEGSLTRN